MGITSNTARRLKTGSTTLTIGTVADGEFLKRDGATVVGAPGGGVGSSVDETELAFTDITTANSSTTKHGLLRKLSNVASEVLDGQGAWRTIAAILGFTPANDADVVHDAGDETIAGVKTFSSDPIVPDEVYGAGWNGSLEPPTKNAVFDKIETLGGASGASTALDNLASVAINTSLISDTDNTDDIGSASNKWKDLYLAGKAIILGIANRFGTATTDDANADTMFSASGATKKALVIQAKASLAANPFEMQYSGGQKFGLNVGPDGNAQVVQRFGGVTGTVFGAYYDTSLANDPGSANAVFEVTYQAQVLLGSSIAPNPNLSFTGVSGGYTSLNKNTVTTQHLLGGGVSPSVSDNGSNASSIAGKDTALKVTVGAGTVTSVVVTFGAAYATAPVAQVGSDTNTDFKWVTTTTGITITRAGGAAFTTGEVLHVVCIGF